MTSPSLLYVCVAYNATVLAEAAAAGPAASQAASIAALVLPRIDHATATATYTHGALYIHYVADGDRVFLTVADAAAGRRLPFTFLASVKDKYAAAFSESDPDADLPHYGRAAFNATLQQLLADAEAGTNDVLSSTRRDIDDVRGIMGRNIESLLERGERIDLLVDQTGRLGGSAHEFRVRSRGLKRQMWWKNAKLMALLLLVGVLIVAGIVLAVKV